MKKIQLTENEAIDIDKIVNRTGSNNWCLICFDPKKNLYNVYSKIDDGESLYKLLSIMREMVIRIVELISPTKNDEVIGNC